MTDRLQRALVLEERGRLSLRDIALPSDLGPRDVRIRVHTVGICGSDVHYYTHGRIGDFVVEEPMVLGHEASGTVIETGRDVSGLAVGDRVCMEPGIPAPASAEYREGLYNLDPAVRFWATPPIHGVLTDEVVHPEQFTYKLPETVSFAQGALVEPLAVGFQAVEKARLFPGATALVTGAGPIGIMNALIALAGGAAHVVIADPVAEKLDLVADIPGLHTVPLGTGDLAATVADVSNGRGVDVAFECSGAVPAWSGLHRLVRPAGAIVVVGLPVEPVPLDWASISSRELRFETVFRYAHQFPRALELMAAGRIDTERLISETFPFEQSVAAFERAAEGRSSDVKLQITI